MHRLPGESGNEFFHRLRAAHEAEEQRRLHEARQQALARGKEPFDESRFKTLYHPPHGLHENLETLEYFYYVVHQDVSTVEEYARSCQQRELYDGGDMHLDR